MLKRIREEKTYKEHTKTDIQQALLNIATMKEDDNKGEMEEVWLDELIQRKKQESRLELAQANYEESKGLCVGGGAVP